MCEIAIQRYLATKHAYVSYPGMKDVCVKLGVIWSLALVFYNSE